MGFPDFPDLYSKPVRFPLHFFCLQRQNKSGSFEHLYGKIGLWSVQNYDTGRPEINFFQWSKFLRNSKKKFFAMEKFPDARKTLRFEEIFGQKREFCAKKTFSNQKTFFQWILPDSKKNKKFISGRPVVCCQDLGWHKQQFPGFMYFICCRQCRWGG